MKRHPRRKPLRQHSHHRSGHRQNHVPQVVGDLSVPRQRGPVVRHQPAQREHVPEAAAAEQHQQQDATDPGDGDVGLERLAEACQEGPDLEHQRAYQLTSGADLGSVSYSVTFEEIDYYASEPTARLACGP